jgi:hypothetical protein
MLVPSFLLACQYHEDNKRAISYMEVREGFRLIREKAKVESRNGMISKREGDMRLSEYVATVEAEGTPEERKNLPLLANSALFKDQVQGAWSRGEIIWDEHTAPMQRIVPLPDPSEDAIFDKIPF